MAALKMEAATDEAWMRLAIAEARRAMEHEDVPVGALIVDGAGAPGTIIGRGHNRREVDQDRTMCPRRWR